MEWIRKSYQELTRDELFAILRARQEVFVVEQNCPYPDIDDTDLKSIHVFALRDGKALACLRYFEKADEPGVIQIGRVMSAQRGKGYGQAVMEAALSGLNGKHLYLEAQVYAIGFYERFGFRTVSEPFDEDGIPHVRMRRD